LEVSPAAETGADATSERAWLLLLTSQRSHDE
jgi:hypothetical protein